MLASSRAGELRCPSCDSSITIRQGGESVTIYTTITLTTDGEVIAHGSRADWCPDCQREWETKVPHA